MIVIEYYLLSVRRMNLMNNFYIILSFIIGYALGFFTMAVDNFFQEEEAAII